MLEIQKKMEESEKRAQDIKRNILKYSALNSSINNMKGISK